LKFLGEIPSSGIKRICGMMDDACTTAEAFRLNISEMGMFQGNGCIRVLWLGLGGQTGQLQRLQSRLDVMLVPLGFESEKRPFTPHITIGQDITFNEGFGEARKYFAPENFSEITVDKLSLFKSEQIGSKRVYTPVYECKLG
jgi:2'-5' RNA ligase